MWCIKCIDHTGFDMYLKATKNTICGRYPILLVLRMLQQLPEKEKSALARSWNWIWYEQSQKINSFADSSVSYASSIAFM